MLYSKNVSRERCKKGGEKMEGWSWWKWLITIIGIIFLYFALYQIADAIWHMNNSIARFLGDVSRKLVRRPPQPKKNRRPLP